jgi:hypothetical protein
MMRIRVASNTGWSPANKALVIKMCKEHEAVFIDRAGVADQDFANEGVQVTTATPAQWTGANRGPKNYVFFTHRGMFDLAFDMTAAGEGYDPFNAETIPRIEQPLQPHPTIVSSLLRLRDELEKRSGHTIPVDELLFKINSCLFSEYPPT